MALLRICERAGLGDGANAELSFEHTETYPITISDPLPRRTSNAWSVFRGLADHASQYGRGAGHCRSTVTYGETLFRQVFADRDAMAATSNSI